MSHTEGKKKKMKEKMLTPTKSSFLISTFLMKMEDQEVEGEEE